MRIVVPALCLSILLLQACTKKTTESDPPFKLAHDGISCEVDGVRKEDYYFPKAVHLNSHSLLIDALGNDTIGTHDGISIEFSAGTPNYVFMGTYSVQNADRDSVSVGLNYSVSEGYYLAGRGVTSIYSNFTPKLPLTVTVTRLDRDRCEGTFSGEVFYQGDASSQNPPKYLTKGIFSVPMD